AARLLGLSLLAGHRQGNVTPLILGALGIQRRQGLFGLGQLGLGLTQASLQRPQFGTDKLGPCGARTALELLVTFGRLGLGLEMFEAGAQLTANVAEPLQILLGMANALL